MSSRKDRNTPIALFARMAAVVLVPFFVFMFLDIVGVL